MPDDPSKLSAVAESEPWEREKAEAARELAWETREMAANLLRVIRGAGRPQDLPQQIINLSESILDIHKSVRAWAIWYAMEEALQSAIPDFDSSEHRSGEQRAMRLLLRLMRSRPLPTYP